MIAQILVLALFPALLLAAAGWDLASFTIPNFIPAALTAMFLILAFAAGLSFSQFGWHVLAGVAGLAAGFALFAGGYIGGGDAKLFAAVALLLGIHDAAAFALISAIFGGGLTLGLLLIRQVPLPQFLAHDWILRLHDSREGVPYGVALAAGAIVLLPYSEIFHAVAAG